jgi:hypothetical protein
VALSEWLALSKTRPGPMIVRFITDRLWWWGLYLGFVAVAFFVNYPGRLYPDSLDMLTQAEHAELLNDWHGPITIWIWKIFAPLFGQPASALFVQSLLIVGYPSLMLARSLSQQRVVRAIACFILLAALIAVTGQVLKDIVLVGLLLCLLASLEFYHSRRQKWALIICASLVVLIALVRPSNFMILGTSATAWAIIRFVEPRRLLFAAMLIWTACAAAVPANQFVNRTLLGARNNSAELSLITFDVAGVSSAIRQDLFAELPGWPTNELPRPWQCYTPRMVDPFLFGECKRYVELLREASHTSSLRFWWISVVAQHPVGYLKHRTYYSFYLIRSMSPILGWGPAYAVNSTPHMSELHSNSTHGLDMGRAFELWEPNITYLPFAWVAATLSTRIAVIVATLACIITLISNWRSGRTLHDFDLVAVISSGIGFGNILMLLLFGIASEGRYLLPTIVCGFVSILLVLERSATPRRSRNPGYVLKAS